MSATCTTHLPRLPEDQEVAQLLRAFYGTARAGGLDRLAGGGGPLGFDVTTALQIQVLISLYGCDGVVESGCHLGDTTEYFARAYPHLPVRACDIDAARAAFTRDRLAAFPNADVRQGDSADLLPGLLAGMRRPLVFLDAHWGPDWPLSAELAALHCAVGVIDDFAIGHPRFGYDTYDGRICGPQLVADTLSGLERMFVGHVEADYPLPCLQTGRRSGTGFVLLGLDDTPLAGHPWFAEIPLRPRPLLPSWTTVGEGQ
ncbi:class I SAM-dependent methyltransferase [Streptomyces sp. NPDC001795]|uniref:class I SAM-dependent methyltransferase n=1 Tax=Streptomyces sp. NPDC001795 TaxID=3154525 RepID=UPI003323E8A8